MKTTVFDRYVPIRAHMTRDDQARLGVKVRIIAALVLVSADIAQRGYEDAFLGNRRCLFWRNDRDCSRLKEALPLLGICIGKLGSLILIKPAWVKLTPLPGIFLKSLPLQVVHFMSFLIHDKHTVVVPHIIADLLGFDTEGCGLSPESGIFIHFGLLMLKAFLLPRCLFNKCWWHHINR